MCYLSSFCLCSVRVPKNPLLGHWAGEPGVIWPGFHRHQSPQAVGHSALIPTWYPEWDTALRQAWQDSQPSQPPACAYFDSSLNSHPIEIMNLKVLKGTSRIPVLRPRGDAYSSWKRVRPSGRGPAPRGPHGPVTHLSVFQPPGPPLTLRCLIQGCSLLSPASKPMPCLLFCPPGALSSPVPSPHPPHSCILLSLRLFQKAPTKAH